MYIEETKKRLEQIQKIKDDSAKTKAKVEINKQIEKQREYWISIKKQLKELIAERKEFITKQTYYPGDYAIKITTLEIFLENVEEYIQKNPLKQNERIEQTILEEKDKVSEYLKLQQNVYELLPKLEKYEETLNTNKNKYDYFTKKQELFICLQKGNLEKVRQLLKYFRPKAKF